MPKKGLSEYVWVAVTHFLNPLDILNLWLTGAPIIHQRLGLSGGCAVFDNKRVRWSPLFLNWPKTLLSRLSGLKRLRITHPRPNKTLHVVLITSSDIQALARSLNTLHLDFDIDGMTDDFLPLLPPHLIRLWLPRNRVITKKGLESLPRTLLELNLAKNPLINDLRALPRSLEVYVGNSAAALPTEDFFRSIPSAMTTLKLRGAPWADSKWAPRHLDRLLRQLPHLSSLCVMPLVEVDASSSFSALSEPLPSHLTTLKMEVNAAMNFPTFQHLPSQMTRLELQYHAECQAVHLWKDEDLAQLPPTLTVLRLARPDRNIGHGRLTPDHFKLLPRNLTVYSCFTLISTKPVPRSEDYWRDMEVYFGQYAQHLPPSLTDLFVAVCNFPNYHEDWLALPAWSLPPKIIKAPFSKASYRASGWLGYRDVFVEPLLPLPLPLPVPLNAECLQFPNHLDQCSLPLDPIIIRFDGASQDEAIKALGRERKALECFACDATSSSVIAHIPKYLSVLDIRFVRDFDYRHLADLPPNLDTINLTLNPPYIPKFLPEPEPSLLSGLWSGMIFIAKAPLNIAKWFMGAGGSGSSITEVNKGRLSAAQTDVLDERSITLLPPSLTELRVNCHSLGGPNHDVPVRWPPQLAALDFTLCQNFEPSFDFPLTGLPTTLTYIYLNGSNVSEKVFLEGERLPPRLLTLILLQTRKVTNRIIPLLPRFLTHLEVPYMDIHDSDVALLPRSLLLFSNKASNLLTNRSMGDWPPSLQELIIPGSNVTLQGLQLLPRTLTKLYLSFALPDPAQDVLAALNPNIKSVVIGRTRLL